MLAWTWKACLTSRGKEAWYPCVLEAVALNSGKFQWMRRPLLDGTVAGAVPWRHPEEQTVPLPYCELAFDGHLVCDGDMHILREWRTQELRGLEPKQPPEFRD